MTDKTFQSRYRKHKLVIEPKRPVFDPETGKRGYSQTKAIQFIDNRYITSDQDEIEFLEDYISKHPRIMFDMSKSKAKVENVEDMQNKIKELEAENQKLKSESETSLDVPDEEIDEKAIKEHIKSALKEEKEKALEMLSEVPEESKFFNWAKNEIAKLNPEV